MKKIVFFGQSPLITAIIKELMEKQKFFTLSMEECSLIHKKDEENYKKNLYKFCKKAVLGDIERNLIMYNVTTPDEVHATISSGFSHVFSIDPKDSSLYVVSSAKEVIHILGLE